MEKYIKTLKKIVSSQTTKFPLNGTRGEKTRELDRVLSRCFVFFYKPRAPRVIFLYEENSRVCTTTRCNRTDSHVITDREFELPLHFR